MKAVSQHHKGHIADSKKERKTDFRHEEKSKDNFWTTKGEKRDGFDINDISYPTPRLSDRIFSAYGSLLL